MKRNIKNFFKGVIFSTALMMGQNARAIELFNVEIPSEVIALTASSAYQTALHDAQSYLTKFEDKVSLQKNIVILGVQSSTFDGGAWEVNVRVGAPTMIWPTCMFEVGTITAQVRHFPDGINKKLADNVKFVGVEAPAPFRNCM